MFYFDYLYFFNTPLQQTFYFLYYIKIFFLYYYYFSNNPFISNLHSLILLKTKLSFAPQNIDEAFISSLEQETLSFVH